jgi:hypothetical protein
MIIALVMIADPEADRWLAALGIQEFHTNRARLQSDYHHLFDDLFAPPGFSPRQIVIDRK